MINFSKVRHSAASGQIKEWLAMMYMCLHIIWCLFPMMRFDHSLNFSSVDTGKRNRQEFRLPAI